MIKNGRNLKTQRGQKLLRKSKVLSIISLIIFIIVLSIFIIFLVNYINARNDLFTKGIYLNYTKAHVVYNDEEYVSVYAIEKYITAYNEAIKYLINISCCLLVTTITTAISIISYKFSETYVLIGNNKKLKYFTINC